jgi:hypothetical protein
VFPVRYGLDLYILFGRNSVLKGLNKVHVSFFESDFTEMGTVKSEGSNDNKQQQLQSERQARSEGGGQVTHVCHAQRCTWAAMAHCVLSHNARPPGGLGAQQYRTKRGSKPP